MVGPDPTHAQLLAVLRQQPKVFEAVVPSAFEDVVDVPSIHTDVREAILQAVAEVRLGGSRMLLVRGEPGVGKTHLLSWLRGLADASSTDARREFVFLSVPPLRDTNRPFLHVLAETVASLRRGRRRLPGDLQSRLGHLLWHLLYDAALAVLRRHQQAEATGPRELIEQLQEIVPPGNGCYPNLFAHEAGADWPRLEGPFARGAQELPDFGGVFPEMRRVLFRFPAEGELAMDWLGGTLLGDDDLRRLGVRESIESDEDAFRCLAALFRLAHLPLVIGVDQVESVFDRFGEEGIRAFFTSLMDLYNLGGRALFLVMCQSGAWARLSRSISQPVLDRIDRQTNLKALTPDEAVALLAARLATVWRTVRFEPPFPTFPFSADEIRKVVEREDMRSPRRVLRCFEDRRRRLAAEPARTTPRAAPEPADQTIPAPADRAVAAAAADVASAAAAASSDGADGGVSRAPPEQGAVPTAAVPRHPAAAQESPPRPGRDEQPAASLAEVVQARLRELTVEAHRDREETPPHLREEAARSVLHEIVRETMARGQLLAGQAIEMAEQVKLGGAGVQPAAMRWRVRPPPPAAPFWLLVDINNRLASRALYNALDRLRLALASGKAEVAVLLREAGLEPGKGAERTRELVDGLRPRGGLVALDVDSVVHLMAIERLLDSASAGEIIVADRCLTRAEVLGEVLGHFVEGLPPLRLLLEQAAATPAASGRSAVSAQPRSI